MLAPVFLCKVYSACSIVSNVRERDHLIPAVSRMSFWYTVGKNNSASRWILEAAFERGYTTLVVTLLSDIIAIINFYKLL